MARLYGIGQNTYQANVDIVGLPTTSFDKAVEVIEGNEFTETAGAGTYTASVSIPIGAIVSDVIFHNTALWTAATSATLKIGDATDDDGYVTAVDVKAAPVAGANISAFKGDTGTGAYKSQHKVYANGGTITGVITTVGTTGNAGRSKMYVKYFLPVSVGAAVKA